MRSGKSLGTGDTFDTGPRSSDPSQDLPVGTMVGEYRIEGRLGEGGMGRVFAAVHPVIAKRAAIKVLHPELSVNRHAVERFVQEARAVNQIGHPNIVDIFSFGALNDGRCYFVMEHLRGESLRDRLDRELPSLGETLAILDTITIALEAAHEKGIIHRDLKPDNIFLVDVKGERPTVKLLDFGIAKLLGNDDSRAQRTQTGNVLGTPAYISPEQARGQGVDHRTDIYALGALAYEMLSGQLPFPAATAADMIAHHLFQAPSPVRDINPNVPVELDALVTSMLAKDMTQRPTLAMTRDRIRACRAMITNQAPAVQYATYPPSGGVAVVRPPGLVTTIAPDARGPVSMPAAVTRPRSRVWIFVLLFAIGIAGGITFAIVATRKGSEPVVETRPTVEPIISPAAAAEPPKPAPAAEPPKPEAIAPAEPPVVEPAPVTKPTKPVKRPTTRPTKKPKVDDDDAPM